MSKADKEEPVQLPVTFMRKSRENDAPPKNHIKTIGIIDLYTLEAAP